MKGVRSHVCGAQLHLLLVWINYGVLLHIGLRLVCSKYLQTGKGKKWENVFQNWFWKLIFCLVSVCDWPRAQYPADPTLCWGVCGCEGVPLHPEYGPARQPLPHWGSWGWGTSSWQPWWQSPRGNCRKKTHQLISLWLEQAENDILFWKTNCKLLEL